MLPAQLGTYRLIATHLGLEAPATYLLKRLLHVDHFYHMTAIINRLRFPRLRSDLRFDLACKGDLDEIVQRLRMLDAASRKDLVARLLFHRRGFSSCYLGRSATGDLVSLQWLIRPRDNALLQKHFRRIYYPLQENQVMIENLFIFPSFRGLATFPTVNHHVLSLAKQEGFQTCRTYIRKDNVTSLNAFFELGFRMGKLLAGYNLLGLSWRTL